MRKPNYTPSPWSAEERERELIVVFAGAEAGNRLAPCFLADGSLAEQRANAKLIAASPLLAQALMRAREVVEEVTILAPIENASQQYISNTKRALAEIDEALKAAGYEL